ncbi:MAG: ribosomal protein S18-alanine N-acetyltransferase [Bryobacteraceae bacterium]
MTTARLPVTVRRAEAADLNRIIDIERACFSDNPWNLAEFETYDCLVAEIEGQIAGFLVSRQLVGNRDGQGEREILNLAIDPAWRRNGIAKILLQQELRRGGSFFLEVRESNLAAQRLYESLHFRRVGKRPEYYSNPVETAIVMKTKEC